MYHVYYQIDYENGWIPPPVSGTNASLSDVPCLPCDSHLFRCLQLNGAHESALSFTAHGPGSQTVDPAALRGPLPPQVTSRSN